MTDLCSVRFFGKYSIFWKWILARSIDKPNENKLICIILNLWRLKVFFSVILKGYPHFYFLKSSDDYFACGLFFCFQVSKSTLCFIISRVQSKSVVPISGLKLLTKQSHLPLIVLRWKRKTRSRTLMARKQNRLRYS